jgi:hypothetical protein
VREDSNNSARGIISTFKPRLSTEGVMQVYLPKPSRHGHKQRTSRESTAAELNFPLQECQPENVFFSQKLREGASLPWARNIKRLPHQGWGYEEHDKRCVNACRRCWPEGFETKMAIKAKAQACSSTYLDIGLRDIGRLPIELVDAQSKTRRGRKRGIVPVRSR